MINCQGTSIMTNHEVRDCPNHCFSLPETESFSVEDYHYSHKATLMTSRATFESTAPSRINLQMKTTGMNFTTEIAKEMEQINSLKPLAQIEEVTNRTSASFLDTIMKDVGNATTFNNVKRLYSKHNCVRSTRSRSHHCR